MKIILHISIAVVFGINGFKDALLACQSVEGIGAQHIEDGRQGVNARRVKHREVRSDGKAQLFTFESFQGSFDIIAFFNRNYNHLI